MPRLGDTSTQLVPSFTEKKIGKCAFNDSVFKFNIYYVEMQDFNINTNLAGLLVSGQTVRTLTKNFCEYFISLLKNFHNFVT